MNPTISLISTVYNRAHYLGNAIESVLAQTYSNFELLIWDDGSTDGSLEIAQRYAQRDERVRVFAASHQGRAASLQAAHAEATGNYLGWIDSDDELLPTALEETAAVLDANPPVGLVYTDYRVIDAEGRLKSNGVRCQIPFSNERLLLDFMTFHFRLIRRTAFEAAGGIDVSIPVAVDYDLCLRLSEVTQIEHLQQALYYYRVHPESISQAQQLRQIHWSKESIARALTRRELAAEWVVEVQVVTSAQGNHQGYFSLVRLGARAVSKKPVSMLSPWVRRVGQALTVLNLSLTAAANPVWAMPVPNADGTGTQVNVDGEQFDITGGTRSGDGRNLFHSFERLNLDVNQIANFVSQPEIQNILGRINGGSPSFIDGLLQVSGGNSNLFLLNPSGILFGNNATLNVPAAFNATTANGIEFGNGWFNATGNNTFESLNGAPIGFAFSDVGGAIANAGNLTVKAGKDLSLLGGTVVSTGQLNAPDGQLTVSSIPGSRYVRLSQPGQLLSLEVLPLSNSATLPNASSSVAVSLPQLLTGGGAINATGVAVGSDGTLELTGSRVAVDSGDVAVKTATAGTAALTAASNLSLVESQIQTTNSLNLSALNTVTVRDSFSDAVNISAGGDLTVLGNLGIDISALNYVGDAPNFRSGGNLDLISDGLILGGGNLESQGNIAFLNLDRKAGDFASQGRSTLRSAGVVDLGHYSGVSLKVEANGSIRAGNITITEPQTGGAPPTDIESQILARSPAVILRAGLTQSASIISVGNVTAHSGVVDLSSNGNVFTGDIDVSSIEVGERAGTISLKAFNVFTGTLNASAPSPVIYIPYGNGFGAGYGSESADDAGNITIAATGLLRTENIDAHSGSASGGNVEIMASDAIMGDINTSGSIDPVRTDFLGFYERPYFYSFKGGDVTITTDAPLQVGAIKVAGDTPGTITIQELGTVPTEVPPTEEPTPPTEEPIPPTEKPTPPTEEPTPPPEEPTPPTENPVTPPEEPTTLSPEEPVPPTMNPVIPTEVPTPPPEVPTPPTDQPTSPTGEPTQAPIPPTQAPIRPSENPVRPAPPAVVPTPTNGKPASSTEAPVKSTESPVPPMKGPDLPTTNGRGEAVPDLDGLDNFTLTNSAAAEPTDELPSISEEERKRVLTNRRNFLKARKLAGKRMTAQEIANLLNIPLAVAELAVLMPVGDEIQVPLSDDERLLEGDLLYAQDITVPGDWKCWIDPVCIGTVIVGGVIVGGYEAGKFVVKVVDKSGRVIAEKTGAAAEAFWNHFFAAEKNKERNPAQDKPLTNGDLKEIEEELGMNGEEIKAEIVGNKNGSKFDLYKDKKGNIYVKPKGNIGPGEPAGYNLNNL